MLLKFASMNRRTFSAARRTAHLKPSAFAATPPGFLNQCRDPRIEGFRLDELSTSQIHLRSTLTVTLAISLHTREVKAWCVMTLLVESFEDSKPLPKRAGQGLESIPHIRPKMCFVRP